jgi:RND family efflux transporter MFP subunit
MSDDTGAGISRKADEGTSWVELNAGRDAEAFAAEWLKLQAEIIGPDLQCALVILGTPDQGPFAPIAIWPVGSPGSPMLVSSVETAMAKRQIVQNSGVRAAAGNRPRLKVDVIAFPLLLDNQICGAVAVEIEHRDPQHLLDVKNLMQLGTGWLEAFARRSRFGAADRLVTVLDLIATSLHFDRFQLAATAVATDMSRALKCERVSIGFLKGKHSRVHALSHSASFGEKANIIRAIEAAMDESIDQQASIVYPAIATDTIQITRAHEQLARDYESGSICTVPMVGGSRILGALVFERPGHEPFNAQTLRLCEHIAALLGPLLEVKRRDDRWLIQKSWDSLQNYGKKLVGPRHTGLKLVSSVLLFLLLFFSLVDGEYRVTADARLEGEIQRAISAPLSGYISDAHFRAGDLVKKGDVLFSLDDRDLWLERLRAAGEHSQYSREYSEAVAKRDRAQTNILTAKIEQAEAQIELIEEQLTRTKVAAPFDGVIVTGDLSQSLGAPVERGDVLFQVAPLDSYRVLLQVNERDVGDVVENLSGTLVLSSLPGEELPFIVEKITPVAVAEQGSNFFIVEARFINTPSPLLRPGMEGVGKIEIEPRKLIWILTYKIIHWMRMFIWSWWP